MPDLAKFDNPGSPCTVSVANWFHAVIGVSYNTRQCFCQQYDDYVSDVLQKRP